MITTRLYLDCRRCKPGQPAPLKLAVSKNDVRALIPLDISVYPEYWDKKNQVALSDYTHLNVIISQKITFIKSLIFQWEITGEVHSLSAARIKDMINERLFGKQEVIKEPEAETFYKRFMDFKDKHSERTKEIYAHTAKRITAFIGEKAFKEILFEDITVRWLKDFDAFMAKTSPSRNARNIHFRNIRAVFNDALDDEVISCYPFRKFKIKAEPTAKRSMTLEDLQKLFTMEVEPYAEIYRDIFKLLFLLIGINTVDLYNLQRVTKDGRVEFKRAKTHRPYSIKVEPEAMEIIEKWKGKRGLTMISDRWVDHVSFRHQFNKSLRLIGATRSGLGGKKSEGLFPDISSYWARHTWATIAADLDIPDAVISQALGHAPENRTTEIYIRRSQKKVDEANRKVIDWVLYGKK